jgi:2,4-diketo-3-deoxy-L-fuconate hydrolase
MFRMANVSGRTALVDADGSWYDAEEVSAGAVSTDPMRAWLQLDELHRATAALADHAPDGRLEGTSVRPPLPAPRSVFAVGLNYRSHAEETGRDPSSVPIVFTKFPSCLAGAFDTVHLGGTTDDYEAELVVVIGRGGRHIERAAAWDHIGGLMVGQDISDRTLQFAAQPPHFDLGKSRDTYGPTGPVVVSPDSFSDPNDLAVRCEVNGEPRQDDRTTSLIFDVPTLVSYLSGILTLTPGDLIFTGTPDGVGAASQRFLRDGDVITTSIEGIGTLTNRCRVESRDA